MPRPKMEHLLRCIEELEQRCKQLEEENAQLKRYIRDWQTYARLLTQAQAQERVADRTYGFDRSRPQRKLPVDELPSTC